MSESSGNGSSQVGANRALVRRICVTPLVLSLTVAKHAVRGRLDCREVFDEWRARWNVLQPCRRPFWR